MLVINTNVSSLMANENGTNVGVSIKTSLEKLSSGAKINKAADNASGLTIADKLRTQKNSLKQSIDNANSGIAMIQIADKAMGEQSNILDIIKTKLIKASTDTTSSDGRKAIAIDVHKYLLELDAIASQTNYNGMHLLQKDEDNTDPADKLIFQIGEKEGDTIENSITIQSNTDGLAKDSDSNTLSDLKDDTDGDGSSLTIEEAKKYLNTIDVALTDLNTMRSALGSTQVQIESSLRNIMTTRTNIASAESVIRDVDYSTEVSNFEKLKIMSEGNSFAKSQANAKSSDVLSLLP